MRNTGATSGRRGTAAAIGMGLVALGLVFLGTTRAGAQDPPDPDSGSCCDVIVSTTTVTETVYVPTTVYETATVYETVYETRTETVTETVEVGGTATETVTETVTENRAQPPDTVTETVTASAGSPITVASPPDPPTPATQPPTPKSTPTVALTGLGAGMGALAGAVLVTRLRRPGERRSARRTREVRAVARPDRNPRTTVEDRAGPAVGIDFRSHPWDIRTTGDSP